MRISRFVNCPALITGLLLVNAVTSVISQRQTDVCTDVVDTENKPRPKIGDLFRVDVECSFSQKGKAAYVREYYDHDNQKSRLRITHSTGLEVNYYLNFKKGEMLIVDPQTSGCDATPIQFMPTFMFGYNYQNQQAHMFSPSGALRFSNVNESYVTKTTVRGIPVNQWRSCQYIEDMRITAEVNWYFSDKTAWDMQLGMEVAPIRMTAAGKKVEINGTITTFSHYYDFFNFDNSVRDHDFEIPDNVFCKERANWDNNTFPNIPDQFYFDGELVNEYQNQLSNVREAYDDTFKLAAYWYKKDLHQLIGDREFTQLNDYKLGASYLIDNDWGSCMLSSLKQRASWFNVQVNGQDIRMQTPSEFFNADFIKFQYAGSMEHRRIPCDRYVGTTNKMPGFPGVNITVEWCFAKDIESWNKAVSNNFKIPILFRIMKLQDLKTPYSYYFNIFYFNPESPFLNELDISSCFQGVNKITLKFTIPGTYKSAAKNNTMATKLAIQDAIRGACDISVLRVSDVKLFFNKNNVVVTFDMLDKPPNYNDVVPPTTQELDIPHAAVQLNNSFRANTVSFYPVLGPVFLTIKPDPNSLEDITGTPASSSGNQQPTTRPWTPNSRSTFSPNTPSQGNSGNQNPPNSHDHGNIQITITSDDLYSGGALAGIGIGFLILGGAGGSAGAFFFFK